MDEQSHLLVNIDMINHPYTKEINNDCAGLITYIYIHIFILKHNQVPPFYNPGDNLRLGHEYTITFPNFL